VTSPFTQCSEEIVNGFLFWPEVAQKVTWVAWKSDALVRDQLVYGGMPLARVFLSQRHRRFKFSSNQYLPDAKSECWTGLLEASGSKVAMLNGVPALTYFQLCGPIASSLELVQALTCRPSKRFPT